MFEVNDKKSYKRFLMWAYISRALSMQVFFYLHYRLKLVKLHCQGFDNTLYLIFNCLNNKKYRVKPKLILNSFKKSLAVYRKVPCLMYSLRALRPLLFSHPIYSMQVTNLITYPSVHIYNQLKDIQFFSLIH